MTLDQIIKLATDAGFENADEPGFWISDGFHLTEIEMFAALVAAAEREACAKICELLATEKDIRLDYVAAKVCAATIRARGK